jgi:hypothetical protein
MKAFSTLIFLVAFLCTNSYSECPNADSIREFYNECILFGKSHEPIVCGKIGCTNTFCYIINECNEIFIGTILSDSSYSIYKDSTQAGFTAFNYRKYKVRIDSALIGKTKAGNIIELLFYEGNNRFKKCRIYNPGRDSTEGMEMYPGFSSHRYNFEHGLKAIFATQKNNKEFDPISGIKAECKSKTAFLECIEKIKNRNKTP